MTGWDEAPRQRAMPDRSADGVRRSDIDRLGWEGRAQRAAIEAQVAAAIGMARDAGGNRRGSPPPESITSSGEESFPTKTKTVVLFIAQDLSCRLRVRPSSVLAHRRGPTCPGHGRNDAYVNGSGTDLNPHNRADCLQTIARLIPGSEFQEDLVRLEPRVEFHKLLFEGCELTFELL